MTTPFGLPICESCARLRVKPDGIGYRCSAFPDGIPEAIYQDGADHRRHFPGDGGILWKLSKERGARERLRLFDETMRRS